jgi:hypothetical protein
VADGRRSAWIGGGAKNEIHDVAAGEEGEATAIFGGHGNKANKNFEAIP